MSTLRRWIHEPWAINAAQIVIYAMGAIGGALAAIGALPTLLTANIGTTLSIAVGIVLIIGGTIGTIAVLIGHWWLECGALLISAIGWVALLPTCIVYAVTGRSTVWIIVVLLVTALCAIFQRYRRIDWAYLNPAK